jgi:hypothetical protein
MIGLGTGGFAAWQRSAILVLTDPLHKESVSVLKGLACRSVKGARLVVDAPFALVALVDLVRPKLAFAGWFGNHADHVYRQRFAGGEQRLA